MSPNASSTPICPLPSLKPASLAKELAGLAETDAEGRRGCVVIRQVSLLRTQLKSDLDLHFGFNYYSALRADGRSLRVAEFRRGVSRCFARLDRRDRIPVSAVLADRLGRRHRATRGMRVDVDLGTGAANDLCWSAAIPTAGSDAERVRADRSLGFRSGGRRLCRRPGAGRG